MGRSLCRDTELILPIPQRNRQAEFITRVDETNCSMLTWVQGEQRYFTSDHELESAAVMTAALHRQASTWQTPVAFVRPIYDSMRVRRGMDLLAEWTQKGLLNTDDVQILHTAGEKGIAMQEALPKNNLTWGILHMDLFPANIVYVDGCANPIDFGSCGFGFFLMDLTNTFCFIGPPRREKYLAFYGKHFPLPENYVDQLEGFFIANRLNAMINYAGAPNASNWLPEDVHKFATREFGSYANGESFLFSGTPFWE